MEQFSSFYLDTARNFLNNEKLISNQKDMDLLVDTIKHHEWLYYIKYEPILSDTEFDILFKKLHESEIKFPEWKQTLSPTERISSSLTENGENITHLTPMLSLANSYSIEDLNDFEKQVRKIGIISNDENIFFTVEPKFDGGSISLIYEKDALKSAATRGDGVLGEDILNNVKMMKSIPLTANFSKYGIDRIELRGEALISKSSFLKLNDFRLEQNIQIFANARNAATGGLRTKDPNETKNRKIEVFIYSVSDIKFNDGNSESHISLNSHYDTIQFLKEQGFRVPHKEIRRCNGIQEVTNELTHWEKERERYDYEIDGLVIKVDDKIIQQKVGTTQHHPRWAIAFKFQAKQGATRLIDVEFQIGKLGAITPVAKLEPLALAGVMISSVSLHNEDFINVRNLMINDMVIVERAGEVIPYIVKSLEEFRNGQEKPIHFPKLCPSCSTLLERKENEATWRCINMKCPAQIVQKLIYFVSKDAMNIDGFGRANMEKFFQLGWVNSFDDIYKLDAAKLATLEGFGEKSIQKLLSNIELSKENSIHRLLHAFSIPQLGIKASKVISGQITNIMDLKTWNLQDYENVKEIGPVLGSNMITFFTNNENIEMLQRLQECGLKFENELTSNSEQILNHRLFNQTILFTGTLKILSRKEAQEKAEAFGAKILSAVSSNLNILVVGENAGSKLKKAEALKTVQLWNEEEFINSLQS